MKVIIQTKNGYKIKEAPFHFERVISKAKSEAGDKSQLPEPGQRVALPSPSLATLCCKAKAKHLVGHCVVFGGRVRFPAAGGSVSDRW